MPLAPGSSMTWYKERKKLGLCTSCDNDRLPSTSRCGQCLAKIPANPEIRRRYKLKARYGITPEIYDSMFNDQQGRCSVCLGEGELVVDHNHITGEVRGLLHRGCNLAIGMLDDDPAILRSAAKYLEDRRG